MHLIRDNLGLLRQGIVLLESLDDDLYRLAPPGLPAGGVGPQVRHVLDYYRCFVRDVDAGRVDYDRRERDPSIETERGVALVRWRELVDDLGSVEPRADATLWVKADADPSLPDDSQWTASTVRRELMFLASHTVHHFALIAITLGAHDVRVPPGFGVAPSTLQHWARTQSVG